MHGWRPAAGRARAARASPGGSITSTETGLNSEEHPLSATGRRKRKDTGTQREQSRGWAPEEDARFMQALDIHGRQWKKVADHVRTR